MEGNEKLCTFALAKTLMYEPHAAHALVENLGSAQDVLNLSSEELDVILGPFSKHAMALKNIDLGACEKELDETLRRGCRYLTLADENFPPLLRECPDGPIGLFVQSSDSDRNIFGRENISVVGTRQITPYGQDWCRRIVQSLAMSTTRPTIVSGLAYGVDITAHKAALEYGLPTIAVLGTGIFNTYPVSHQCHADRIASTPQCAIISEYPPSANIQAINFLSRNRIIAGMSRCTLLMESRIKGGGMATARNAASYSREVFALPGRNCDPCSQGCNLLIQSHVAEPIIGCDEFFRALDYKLSGQGAKEKQASIREFYSGGMDQLNIRQCEALVREIRKDPGLQIDELADRTGMEYNKANILLRRLENDGFIIIDMLQRCTVLRKFR